MTLYLDRFNSEELTKCRDAQPLVFSLNLVLQYYFYQYLSRLHLNQHLHVLLEKKHVIILVKVKTKEIKYSSRSVYMKVFLNFVALI